MYVLTPSFVRYNKEELKNQSIRNLQTLVKNDRKIPNDVFKHLKRLIVLSIKKPLNHDEKWLRKNRKTR